MIKKSLSLGIILLFILSAMSTLGIGYNRSINQEVSLSSGPMDSPWPMSYHDQHHTGRSPYSTADNPLFEKWRFKADGWVDDGIVIDDNGVLYFGDWSRHFYAVYPNGTEKWRYKTLDLLLAIPAIAEDGTVYIGDFNGNFYAFNPNGTVKWRFKTRGAMPSDPIIADDGTIYVGVMGGLERIGWVYAINPNGTEKWRFETNDSIISDGAIGDDGTLYIGSLDSCLYAIYPNGTLRWRFKTYGEIHGHPSIADDGTIYFTSFDDHLYALNPDGSLKWKFYYEGTYVSAPVMSKDGTIYVGGRKFSAVSPDGTLKWDFEFKDEKRMGHSTPAISDDGTIFVGLCTGEYHGGELIAFNPHGSVEWRSGEICNLWLQSSPCIGVDGTVYVGSSTDKWGYIRNSVDDGGYIHAFGTIDSNEPPNPPSIHGKVKYKPILPNIYGFSTTDPDNSPVAFYVEWGDGTHTYWTGGERGLSYSVMDYAAPNEIVYLPHYYLLPGKYTIRAKARDNLGEESDWETLTITLPRNKVFNFNSMLEWFQLQHPRLFPLLRQILKI